MTSDNQLLTLLILVFPLTIWLNLDHASGKSLPKRLIASVVLSNILISANLMLAGYSGFFTLQFLILAFLFSNLFLLVAAFLGGRITRNPVAWNSVGVDLPEIACLLCVTLLAFFFYTVPYESTIPSENDPSTFLYAGLNLAKTGRMIYYESINTANLPVRFNPCFTYFDGNAHGFASSGLFSLWIGLMYLIGGLELAYFTPLIFAITVAFIFYELINDLFGPKTAILSTLLLMGNYAQVITAKHLFAENLFQFLFFAALYLALQRKILPSCLTPVVVGFTFGLIAHTKLLEGLFIGLVLIAICIIQNRSRLNDLGGRFPFLIALVSTMFAAILSAFAYKSRYVDMGWLENLHQQLATTQTYEVVVVSVFLLISFVIIRRFLWARVLTSLTARTWDLIFLLLLGLFLYAMFLRPIWFYSSPNYYPDIRKMMQDLSQAPNFDWISLVRLSYFVTPIIPFLCALGIREEKAMIRNMSSCILFVCGLAFTIIFLYRPEHDPNIEPWVRRFQPIVIPFMILLASRIICKSRILLRRTRLIVAILLAVIFLMNSATIAHVRNYEGSTSQMERLASTINNEDLLVFYYNGWFYSDYKIADSLKYVFGKNVLSFVVLNGSTFEEVVGRYKGTFKNIYVLTIGPLPPDHPLYSQLTYLQNYEITTTRLNWEYYTLPKEKKEIVINVFLYSLKRANF